MHVEWSWIKQRPHFLFEELTRFYSTDLFFIHKTYGRKKRRTENSYNVYSPSEVRVLKKLPFSGRVKWLRSLERQMNRKVIRTLNRYDCFWITSPLILDFLPIGLLKNKVVIYDCMDDFLEFYIEQSNRERLKALEINLIENTNILFASSCYLENKLKSNYSDYLKIEPIVINNGVSPKLLSFQNTIVETGSGASRFINIVYFGTIEKWIDFDIILNVLSQLSNVIFTMIGPVVTEVPKHSRLKFIGAVEHSQLPSYTATADAFIMPFKLTELIRSVDPVKIYEYIYFHKPIFAINYGEMQKFLPFVHLYSSEAELLGLIEDLQNDRIEMYSEDESIQFLQRNTWSSRCKQIVEVLEGVLK